MSKILLRVDDSSPRRRRLKNSFCMQKKRKEFWHKLTCKLIKIIKSDITCPNTIEVCVFGLWETERNAIVKFDRSMRAVYDFMQIHHWASQLKHIDDPASTVNSFNHNLSIIILRLLPICISVNSKMNAVINFSFWMCRFCQNCDIKCFSRSHFTQRKIEKAKEMEKWAQKERS